MIKLDNTKRFYDEIKTMGFFQRLFSWGKIIPLLTESYAEISKIEEIADKNNELTSDLKVAKEKIESLNSDVAKHEKKISSLETDIKHFNQDIKSKESEVAKLEETKEQNTDLISNLKSDIKSLINQKAIKAAPYQSQSRARARKLLVQKRKGRRKGQGSRKGKKTARLSTKEAWMQKIRLQRTFLKSLKEKNLLTTKIHRNLILKAKGGFFRSKRHIKLFIEEHNLIGEQK